MKNKNKIAPVKQKDKATKSIQQKSKGAIVIHAGGEGIPMPNKTVDEYQCNR